MGRLSGVLVGSALLAYLGAYFAMLQPANLTILDGASGYRGRLPAYRMGGSVTATAFRPLLWLDKQIRPRYWAWESLPYGSSCMSVPSQAPNE